MLLFFCCPYSAKLSEILPSSEPISECEMSELFLLDFNEGWGDLQISMKNEGYFKR